MRPGTAKLDLVPAPPAPPDAPEPVDRDLVQRAARGDAAAFRRLFDRHAPPVCRFLGDLLRDDAAADEATQETFVRAHARLSALRESGKLATWLFGIARLVALEEVRARRRHPVAPPPDSDGSVDCALSPEGLLMAREADQLLGSALEELDEERRAALLLRVDHGLDYAEVGAVMGWAPAKVKNEIHRARLTLRARLSKYIEGEA
jgi:RNA polymerase sigma-70 factor (ECF subfamily)